MKKYDFGEHEYEYVAKQKVPVKMLPKYKANKEKVIKLLESEEYKNVLQPGDFWILMNFNKDKSECYYSGLIISHEALLRINDSLPDKDRFNQRFCSPPIVCSFKGNECLRMEYRDERDGMYEVGEISATNCKNDYPYAMLVKRTFDRVVKRKAKLSMVYSDSEADEFREHHEAKPEPNATDDQIANIIAYKDVIIDELMTRGIAKPSDVEKLSVKEASRLCKLIEERMNDVQ